MEIELIARLLKPFVQIDSLSQDQLSHISMYIDILLKWNARMNLTSVRQPEQIIERHFGESLFAAQQIFPSGYAPGDRVRVVDVGSGAGFPGIPIKIWAPDINLTLIESNQKKVTFLREVSRTLELERVDVFNDRAENFTKHWADIVILRAVESFSTVLPVAVDVAKDGEKVALLIGTNQVDKARALDTLSWDSPIQVPNSSQRVILLGRIKSNLD